MSPTYIKPPEPQWTIEQQLRHLLTMLRATALQASTLAKVGNPDVRRRVNQLAEFLGNSERGILSAGIKTITAEKLTNAEEYLDNEGSLLWEACNEVRKQPDRTNALLVLYALTSGDIVEQETGLPPGQEPTTKP